MRKRKEVKTANLDKYIPKISGTAPKGVEGYHMELGSKDKGVVRPSIRRRIGGVCPKIINYVTNKIHCQKGVYYMNNFTNNKNDAGITETINQNKEATAMSNNANNNDVTINAESTEENAMMNDKTNNAKETDTMESNAKNVTDDNAKVDVVENGQKINIADLPFDERIQRGFYDTKKIKKIKRKNMRKKDTTMKKETKKNEAPAKPHMSMPFDNWELMIPKEETAVSETDTKEETTLTLADIIQPSQDITSEIPEEEREETEETFLPALAEINQYGLFSPVSGMVGLITNTGHRFYAKICGDSKGMQSVEFRQQYENGKFSPNIKMNQADLLTAASYNFTSKRIDHDILKKKVSNFIMDVHDQYYGTLLYPREGMSIELIMKLLLSHYDKLPVERSITEILNRPNILYPKVIEIITNNHLNIIDEHKAYYTIFSDDMDKLADKLSVSKNQLLKKMKEYHFLYLTDSSNGYQTCVRFKSCDDLSQKPVTEWCYCILKLDYLASLKKEREQK